ncbi:NAD(P)H-dependent flavin oxidoreductase [Marinobacter sp. X15-166B]|uniref:NAD(P)H-dependent flavin oxidoreductase n=1 Tax=Marinobacter sp. X15-166B TaxID=1897620 RepID=UPI00085C5100|nr:nitronate monooxygenase [Marinobacter sp. X15-166B]OEY65339.1 2-nitropropane dioxygenase [Marinobacter sp. X15-166B]
MAGFDSIIKVSHPIIQAPMAGTSTPELAAAVSNAGALGSIGLGGSSVAQAQAWIEHTRRLTSQPFNVNLFCHRPAVANAQVEAGWLAHLAPYFAEFGATAPSRLEAAYPSFVDNEPMLAMLLAEKPAVVSFHFGLPDPGWIRALKTAGIRLLATATSLAEAEAITAAGLHGIVAQGIEAGGHSGVFSPEAGKPDYGVLALVRVLASRCDLPVIAAGGIMDGRGIRAALASGACGVQMGTAFVLCPESAADASYREALKGATADRTRITSVISGRPARGLVDRWWLDIDGADAPELPGYPMVYHAGKALRAAARKQGNQQFNAHWAGQGVPLAREMPAGDLVRVLVGEMQEP